MSVTTGTLTVAKVPLGSDVYELYCTISATGDGTGGNVSVNKDLSNYIPENSKVLIISSYAGNNSANTEACHTTVNSDEWECPIGLVAMWNDTLALQYGLGTYWMTHSTLHPLPIYLGKPLKATKAIIMGSETNSNAKTYTGVFRLRIYTNQPT